MELLASHLEGHLTALRDNIHAADDDNTGLLQISYETLQAYAESVEFEGFLADELDGISGDPMRQTCQVMMFAN